MKKNNEGYFLEVDIQYPGESHKFHNDLSFLPERMKIEKVEVLVANLHEKKMNKIHRRNLKQALNYRLVLKNCV